MTKFCRKHKLDRGHMYKVAKGIYKQYKGYTVEYDLVEGGVL